MCSLLYYWATYVAVKNIQHIQVFMQVHDIFFFLILTKPEFSLQILYNI